jgi:hypothetical protein
MSERLVGVQNPALQVLDENYGGDVIEERREQALAVVQRFLGLAALRQLGGQARVVAASAPLGPDQHQAEDRDEQREDRGGEAILGCAPLVGGKRGRGEIRDGDDQGELRQRAVADEAAQGVDAAGHLVMSRRRVVDPLEHRAVAEILADCRLLLKASRPDDAVPPHQQNAPVRADFEVVVVAGEIRGVEADGDDAGEGPVGPVQSPAQEERPGSRELGDDGFADVQPGGGACGVHPEVFALRDVGQLRVVQNAQEQVAPVVRHVDLVDNRVSLGAVDKIAHAEGHPAVAFVLVLKEKQRAVGGLHDAPHVFLEGASQAAVLAVDALDLGFAIQRLAMQDVEPGRRRQDQPEAGDQQAAGDAAPERGERRE